jgi:hypothetical protein
MLMVYKRIKESLCLGTAEKFQIWWAVLTNDQPKMSSFYVIRDYVWFLLLKFFEFHREFWLKFAN